MSNKKFFKINTVKESFDFSLESFLSKPKTVRNYKENIESIFKRNRNIRRLKEAGFALTNVEIQSLNILMYQSDIPEWEGQKRRKGQNIIAF